MLVIFRAQLLTYTWISRNKVCKTYVYVRSYVWCCVSVVFLSFFNRQYQICLYRPRHPLLGKKGSQARKKKQKRGLKTDKVKLVWIHSTITWQKTRIGFILHFQFVFLLFIVKPMALHEFAATYYVLFDWYGKTYKKK